VQNPARNRQNHKFEIGWSFTNKENYVVLPFLFSNSKMACGIEGFDHVFPDKNTIGSKN